jgi:Fic family protein
MHVSTDTNEKASNADKFERGNLLAEAVFQDRPSMRYADLIEAVKSTLKISNSTAERRLRELLRLKVVVKSVAGLYTKGT